MDFTRQMGLFNPEKQRMKIVVFGAGSVGSFVTLNLAKLGFEDITIIDFDNVEEHNIPNQFYRLSDVNKPKVEALKEIVKDFTGVDVTAINQKVTEETDLFSLIELDTIFVICLDNMEVRKVIYNKIKDNPVLLVDTRMGGNYYTIDVCNPYDEQDAKEYIEGLDVPIYESPCGEKSIIYTILSISSETCNLIKRIDKKESFTKRICRDMNSWKVLSKKEVK